MPKPIIHALHWVGRLALSIVTSQLVRWALRNTLEWFERPE